MDFPNYAGRSDVDRALMAELQAAGIEAQDNGRAAKQMCRREVQTGVVGLLHAWVFERGHTFWAARGPGLQPLYATPLHAAHGAAVRVDGHCGAPSPLEWGRGFAVGLYHVDTTEGLQALVEALNRCVADAAVLAEAPETAAAPAGRLKAGFVQTNQPAGSYFRQEDTEWGIWPEHDTGDPGWLVAKPGAVPVSYAEAHEAVVTPAEA